MDSYLVKLFTDGPNIQAILKLTQLQLDIIDVFHELIEKYSKHHCCGGNCTQCVFCLLRPYDIEIERTDINVEINNHLIDKLCDDLMDEYELYLEDLKNNEDDSDK